MIRPRGRPSPTALLSGTAIGVYFLVIAGATASFADVAAACGSWPSCSGSLADPTVLIAVSHRLAAAVVAGLVLATAVVVLRADVDLRVKAAVAAGLVLYPVQIGLGALVALQGAGGPFPGVHLAVGVGIFGAVVLALAWHLEAETGTTGDETAVSPEPASVTGEAADGDAPTAAGTTPLADRPLGARVRTRLYAYFRLMKPRLMWLLCLVAAAGMALAAQVGARLSVETIVLTLGGGVLAIGASGTFNHVIERDKDKRMARTADRPVATHEVPVRRATVFGVALTALSLWVFWQVNAMVAALGLVAILFYSVIYTVVLKPNTVQNTVIGGAAGALPALIGSAAVTGDIGLAGLTLAGVIFLWTPAHFYNLALAYQDDYARGGFPMMPVVRGETTTRKHVLFWLGATLAGAAGLIWVTDLGWLAAATTVALGGVFLWAVVELHHEQTERAAFRAFHASNAYLGLFLVAILVDALAV